MHFLITAGGSREYIDPVRFISNASSGKMGYALVRAALRAGHNVALITAPTRQRVPNGSRNIGVETAAQMFEAVRKNFSACDCLIMAAAVADYTPARPSMTKIQKGQESLNIRLKPTTDILRWAGRHKKKGQVVVGFALEDKAMRTRAERKRKAKNVDMIVANNPAAIGSDRSTVQIKKPGYAWIEIKKATKASIARRIIRLVESIASETKCAN